MERISLLLDKSTVEMLHLLARRTGKTIGTLVHEMALEKYMNHAVSGVHDSDFSIVTDEAATPISKSAS